MPQGARTDLAPIGATSRAKAADMLNVGERNVTRAREVLDRAAPEVVAAVERGDLAVSAAAKVAARPAEEQVDSVES